MKRWWLCGCVAALGLCGFAGCASTASETVTTTDKPYDEEDQAQTPGERHNGPQPGRAGEDLSW